MKKNITAVIVAICVFSNLVAMSPKNSIDRSRSMGRLTSEIAKLKAEKIELQKQIDVFNNDSDKNLNLTYENKQLIDENNRLKEKLKFGQQRLSQSIGERFNLISIRENLQKERDELQKKLDFANSQIDDFQYNESNFSEEQEQILSKLNDARRYLEVCKRKIKILEEKNKELNHSILQEQKHMELVLALLNSNFNGAFQMIMDIYNDSNNTYNLLNYLYDGIYIAGGLDFKGIQQFETDKLDILFRAQVTPAEKVLLLKALLGNMHDLIPFQYKRKLYNFYYDWFKKTMEYFISIIH